MLHKKYFNLLENAEWESISDPAWSSNCHQQFPRSEYLQVWSKENIRIKLTYEKTLAKNRLINITLW